MYTAVNSDDRVLLITFTDQLNWGLNKHNENLHLNCTTDIDEHWRACTSQYFTKFICYDVFKSANSSGIIAANKELIAFAKSYKPKFVIYPSRFDGVVTLETLEALKNMGTKIVAFFFDDDVYYDKLSKFMIPYIDFAITPNSREIVKKYKLDGCSAFFSAPIPMSSNIFCKLENIGKKYEVSFIGNSQVADRGIFIEELQKTGFSLLIRGGVANKLHFSEVVQIINETKINLHFSKQLRDGYLFSQLKGRIFEITMSGGFLLCEYLPGIEEFFEIDKEIVCFKTVEEAIEKITYYLKHDDKRNEIAHNGFLRSSKNYNGITVINKIFEQIKQTSNDSKKRVEKLDLYKVISPLHEVYSQIYVNWCKVFLKSSYPLRSQWSDCLSLALKYNPKNRTAKLLLLKSKFFGDPRPIIAIFYKIRFICKNSILKAYTLTRRKLRFVKKTLKK